MKKFPISLLCGIAVVLVTVILFFTILGDAELEAIHILSLFAIIIAEVIATVYAVTSKGNPRKVAAAIVSALMVPATVWLSCVYISLYPDNCGTYMGLYSVATILVNAVALILVFFNAGKAEEEAQFQSAKNNMLYMRKLVKVIMTEPAAREYEAKLREIEEKLHFSNDSVTVPEDTDIYRMLSELKQNINNPEYDTTALLIKLEQTIAQRNIMASRNA